MLSLAWETLWLVRSDDFCKKKINLLLTNDFSLLIWNVYLKWDQRRWRGRMERSCGKGWNSKRLHPCQRVWFVRDDHFNIHAHVIINLSVSRHTLLSPIHTFTTVCFHSFLISTLFTPECTPPFQSLEPFLWLCPVVTSVPVPKPKQ